MSCLSHNQAGSMFKIAPEKLFVNLLGGMLLRTSVEYLFWSW